MIEGFSKVILFATRMAAGILNAFASIFSPIAKLAHALHLPFADSFDDIVSGARSAAKRINSNLAKVDSDLAQREIGRLQKKVNSLKGKKVKTEADRAAIAASESRIGVLQGRINRLHGKTIRVTTQYLAVYNSEVRRDAATARRARASGGPVGKGLMYLVGEQGPELFTASSAGTILSAAATRSAAAGRRVSGFRSASGGSVVLEIRSGGSAVDDFIVGIIRKSVRVKGGDVQKALGQA
jgi:hypothetical protein